MYWRILLVINCRLVFLFFYVLLFSIYAAFYMCVCMHACMYGCVCALCKFALYKHLLYLLPTPLLDCWCLPQLVLSLTLFVRGSTSITLNCKVLKECQEWKGNTSVPFFLSLRPYLILTWWLVCNEPIRW